MCNVILKPVSHTLTIRPNTDCSAYLRIQWLYEHQTLSFCIVVSSDKGAVKFQDNDRGNNRAFLSSSVRQAQRLDQRVWEREV